MGSDFHKVGWRLVSAEERSEAFPDTFHIPSNQQRRSLKRGAGAQILVDIETREGGIVVDRGIDRMWVYVVSVLPDCYNGVLDSNPGIAENLKLAKGDIIRFAAKHICKIDYPPDDFLAKEYGQYFPNAGGTV